MSEHPIRFAIIGAGWRAMYYVRIAAALPDTFAVSALLCRNPKKAVELEKACALPVTTSPQDVEAARPNFVVVAVDKAHIAGVSLEWLRRGYPVLAETPAAMDTDTLMELRVLAEQAPPLVFAEQYRRYPENIARLRLIEQGVIGAPQFLYLSFAHEYHAASLMRALLNIPAGSAFSVAAAKWSYPTVETLSRYERFTDGRTADKTRTAAIFSFAGGAACLYDFDSEQYRSPIRSSYIKLQGSRGEIAGDTVRYMDAANRPQRQELVIETRTLQRPDENPNVSQVEEVTGITWSGGSLYTPPFGPVGLTRDETAIAAMLRDMGRYVRGESDAPYSLADALQDAFMGIRLREAAERGLHEDGSPASAGS